MTIFVNGKLTSSEKNYPLPREDTKIVFESLRSYGGVIFRLEEHLRRLLESAKTIDLKLPKSTVQLERELKSCLSQSSKKDAFLRISVDEQNSYILVTERKRPAWIYEQGVQLKTVVMRKNIPNAIPSEIKTNAFLTNVLAVLDPPPTLILPHKGGGRQRPLNPLPPLWGEVGRGEELIFLDTNGYIAEGTIWNIFMVKENKLLTPEVDILKGVTRQFVMECARFEDLPVKETNLTRHDLWNADEAFLTNTSGEIVPIRSLDGRFIGNSVPGPTTQKLIRRFQKQLAEEINSSM